MMIKGILFDLDGTLLDRDQSLVAFLENQYNLMKAIQVVERQSFIQRFIQLDQSGYVWKDKVYEQLINEFQIKLTWGELLNDYEESFQSHCIGFDGLIEILEWLKSQKIKLGVISNGFGRFQMNNIKGLMIDHYFDDILISEIEGLRKPDIKLFKRAIDRLGLKPEESMFVGDHPINDVEASVNAGMIGVWKENDCFEKPSGKFISIKHLMEIRDFIAGKMNKKDNANDL